MVSKGQASALRAMTQLGVALTLHRVPRDSGGVGERCGSDFSTPEAT